MDIIEKWNQIIDWQKDNSKEKTFLLAGPIENEDLKQMEELIGEALPAAFKTLYLYADGQIENGPGMLFGEEFMNSKAIINQLEISRTFLKPKDKKVEHPEKSKLLLDAIVDFYIAQAPQHKLFGFQKSWYKIEFSCSTGSYGGPYLYKNKNTTEKEREILEIEYKDYKSIAETIEKLAHLEKESYNWDELKFIVYADGKYEVEREYYNFDEEIPFTSTPENAIKKKYFHYKWIPIFSDYGCNYIGIDLDPDINGTKGQIINFGRDEEKMIVIAPNLESFFDFILNEIKANNAQKLKSEFHLHDQIREIKTQNSTE